MQSTEDRREGGAGLMFVGLALWVADALVLFFLPSGVRAGREAIYLLLMVILAVAGLVLIIVGFSRRSKAGGPDE